MVLDFPRSKQISNSSSLILVHGVMAIGGRGSVSVYLILSPVWKKHCAFGAEARRSLKRSKLILNLSIAFRLKCAEHDIALAKGSLCSDPVEFNGVWDAICEQFIARRRALLLLAVEGFEKRK
jgi:hypothetical protein